MDKAKQIRGCLARGNQLSSWERDFVRVMKSYHKKRGFLTDSQDKVFMKIWERVQ